MSWASSRAPLGFGFDYFLIMAEVVDIGGDMSC